MKPLAWFTLMLCAVAAHRLLRWDVLVDQDRARLDRLFGASPRHRDIAEDFARLSVLGDLGFAAVSAMLL
ncbi:hypothetical protein [Piscinibacter defluvii]|uniref:hypothetical protein n=1 Tax=Piscinibacter defluvii TaxID=1796922 RepID=UPI000FDEDD81|nr:hypothetical protein [Piscinibacter defluvii]